MASESDSDCELYTKTAERVQFKSRVGEIEDVINLVDDDDEVAQIMQEVDAGLTPMAALLKVQIDNITKENALISSSQFNSSESNVSTPPSIDITMFDGPRELCKVIKKDDCTSKNITTRVSTRASTRASTMASLAKVNKSLTSSAKNGDSASQKVDVCTPVINGNDVVQDDVIVIEDQDEAEGLGSIAQGSGRKRGRPSKANGNVSKRVQTATTSSNSRVLDTIVFDDDSAYCNTITTPIEFNKNYHCKLSISPNDSLNDSLNISSDLDEDWSEREPVKITIEWSNSKGMTRKDFQLRKYQKFESVFEDLAKLEGISVKRVVLMQQYTSISPVDSPATLNMNFYGALTGYASDIEFNQDKHNLSEYDNNAGKKPEGTISLKVQMESKETFIFQLVKNSKMNTLYLMASEELRCDKDKLKLLFDGECVSPDVKLSRLDVEDGDVFHGYIKK